jgi:hypothetical protein
MPVKLHFVWQMASQGRALTWKRQPCLDLTVCTSERLMNPRYVHTHTRTGLLLRQLTFASACAPAGGCGGAGEHLQGEGAHKKTSPPHTRPPQNKKCGRARASTLFGVSPTIAPQGTKKSRTSELQGA